MIVVPENLSCIDWMWIEIETRVVFLFPKGLTKLCLPLKRCSKDAIFLVYSPIRDISLVSGFNT